ncbi:MAG: transporter [Pseudomonadota bacterium]
MFGTAGIGRSSAGDNDFFQATNAIGLGFPIASRVGGFIEHFIAANDGLADFQTIDGGITWLVTDHIQLDVTGGVGVDGPAPDGFVGGGIAIRW